MAYMSIIDNEPQRYFFLGAIQVNRLHNLCVEGTSVLEL